MTGRRRDRRRTQGLTQWGIFLGVATALFLLIWAGWSIVNQRHPSADGGVVRSDSSATVGLTAASDSPAPSTLDIRTADSAELDRALIGNVYQTLIDRTEKNTLKAGIASSWKTSADGRTLTLTLRKGLTFSNGDALDSSDVVSSLQHAVEGKWPGASERFAALTSVTNPDSSTVTIALSRPDATLPYTLSGRLGIVYDAEADVDYATHAIGSGPFTVSKFVRGRSITLSARTDGTYAPSDSTAAAKTGTVTLRYYADDAALGQAAKTGALDMTVPSDPASATTIGAAAPSFTTAAGDGTRKVTLLYNNDTDSILSVVRVRQAITMIIDRQTLTSGRADVAQVLGGPIGPLEPGYEDLTSILPHDTAQARSMLSYFSSNYLGTLTLATPERYRTLADGIAAQLTAAGLRVDVQTLDATQLAQRVQDRQFTLMIAELDGEDGTAAFADASSAAHYTNATAQEQYRAAVGATDTKSYEAGLKTYARTVSEDAASDWLYTRRTAIAVSTKLTGYPTRMTDERLPLAGLARR
ncbi:ABC transporter substrate-binding protein [Bifidobacterium sp. MA2]|uniref:ABC transporter substrate-binding protein n=1 Tax=Bifidobacterium santillanense TaxID=2809028 RepID=A0ABS5UQT1_9BIFI|nr:ABC transporter substrate-binding protein [Bifidobacterium santillanense]MBT1173249.1 ABC transporter substrate-binding protein [Bifidobacterium santillanense]